MRAVTEVLTVEVTKGLGIIWQLDLPDECVLNVIHRISASSGRQPHGCQWKEEQMALSNKSCHRWFQNTVTIKEKII